MRRMVEGMDKSLGDMMATVSTRQGVAGQHDRPVHVGQRRPERDGRGGEPHTHNRPLSSGKGSAHEGGIREPMIVQWPGVPSRARSARRRSSSRISSRPFSKWPARRPSHRRLPDGRRRELRAAAARASADRSERPRLCSGTIPNIWGPTGPGIGAFSTIRQGDWKLIYYHADRRFELFNLATTSARPRTWPQGHGDKVRALAALLTQHLDRWTPRCRPTRGRVAPCPGRRKRPAG